MHEFEFIEKIMEEGASDSRSMRRVTKGIGDDCAIIPQETGTDTLISTDMLIEGTHFTLDRIGAYMLGSKSASVNISDIAAMGGTPTAAFLSLALPSSLDDEWRMEFIKGFLSRCKEFDVALLGGDTTASPDRLCINVTVMGTCTHGKAIRRDRAKVGDLVCVTGTLGNSAAGLRLLLEGDPEGCNENASPNDSARRYLVFKHLMPYPMVWGGQKLLECGGVHAMMDISDGVASDLRHILHASGVGAEIDVLKLPLSDQLKQLCSERGWDPVELALCGGEDYELLFTIDPQVEPDLFLRHYIIGKITADPDSIEWIGGKSSRDYLGFRHF